MSLCINPNCTHPQNSDTALFCTSCGSELLLEARYRPMENIGQGGFGRTYEIIDCATHNLKILKVLLKNHPKYIDLFKQEAFSLAKIKHSGIPKVEDDAYFTFFPQDSQDPVHCLIMEKIEGLNLLRYMQKRNSPLKQKVALKWLIELVDILHEIHKCNFFHRDIKPSNIMLNPDGKLVLIDFGSVREITPSFLLKQAEGEITKLISRGYTPGEQMCGKAVPQSDFFALGYTIIYLLTCKDPSELSHICNINSWRELVPNIAPQFADFLDYMIAPLPENRPQTTEVILKELREIYDSLYPNTKTESSYELPSINLTRTTVKLTNTNISETKSTPKTNLKEDFILLCQKELAELIGPIASILCQQTLKKNPTLSPQEFVEALANKIPDKKLALQFHQRILKNDY